MTTYNTGNPIGSAEVKDLYDNAENLDIAINSPSADVWTDRLGQARKTWRGIQNEAQLEIAQVVGEVTAQSQQYLDASIVARDEARAAASASGPIAFFGTYAAAQAAVGGLPDGGIVEVSQDETRVGARTRYKVQAGALVFIVNLDQTRLDLATPTGSALIGNGAETVAQSFDALQLADYTALRASTSPRKTVYVTGYLVSAAPSGIAGMFIRDDSDTTTADNGGTVIVRADGKRYKRPDSGELNVQWFGAKGDWNGTTGADDTAAIQAALNSIPSNFPQVYTVLLPAPVAAYQVSATITNARGGIHIKGEGGAKIQWTGADSGLVFSFGVLASLTYRYRLSGFSIYGTFGGNKPHCIKFTQVSEFNADGLSFFSVRDVYTLNRVNIGFISDQYCYMPDNFIVGAQTATAANLDISNGQIFMDRLNVYSCSQHFCDVRSGIFTSLTITNSWIEQFTHFINVSYNGTDTTSFGLARLRLENLDLSSCSRLIYAYGSANGVINPFFVSLDINRIYAANKTGSLPWIEINKNGNTQVSSAYGKEINLSSIEIQSSNLSSGVLNITGGSPNVRVKSILMETPGPILVSANAVPVDMPKVVFATTWASTANQPILGNGVLASSYTADAGIVRVSVLLAIGSTTTPGSGNYTFSLPVRAAVDSSALGLGTALLVSGGGGVINHGSALIDNNGTTMTIFFGSAAWANGAPVALAAGNVLRVNVSYRVA